MTVSSSTAGSSQRSTRVTGVLLFRALARGREPQPPARLLLPNVGALMPAGRQHRRWLQHLPPLLEAQGFQKTSGRPYCATSSAFTAHLWSEAVGTHHLPGATPSCPQTSCLVRGRMPSLT